MTAKPPVALDRKQIRHGALAVGAIALVGALGAAVMNGDPRPPPAQEAPAIAGPAITEPTVATPAVDAPAPEAEPVFETAGADAAPLANDASFLVRFEPTHELGRAQALAAQGRIAEARRRAETALRTRADLRGLCFDRFTAGGAEILVRPCPGAPAQNAGQQSWITRLRAMPGVEYADANLPAQPDTRTP